MLKFIAKFPSISPRVKLRKNSKLLINQNLLTDVNKRRKELKSINFNFD